MKKVIIVTINILLFFTRLNAQNQTFNSRPSLLLEMQNIVDEFKSFIKPYKIELPDNLKLEIKSTNSLIYIRDNIVTIPYWNDLSQAQKDLFKRWKGENAEEFFNLLFNWFFIPHELGHAISKMLPRHYDDERQANQIAYNFFASNDKNKSKLDYLKQQLEEVLEVLPKPDLKGMHESEYFETFYSEISQDPDIYGYFQFRYILEIIESKKNIDLNEIR